VRFNQPRRNPLVLGNVDTRVDEFQRSAEQSDKTRALAMELLTNIELEKIDYDFTP
jgi:hypothetical protein